jgi:hypothetical protein
VTVFAEAEAVFAQAEAGLAVAMLARQDWSKPSVHSERYQVRDVCLAAEQRPALRSAARADRWALEWSGVTIATPYRPWPTKPGNRLVRGLRRCK